MAAIVWWLAATCLLRAATAGNPDAKRLYDDLLSNYNKLVRPVVNTTDVLRVCIKLKLSQLIDVVSVTLVLSSRSAAAGPVQQSARQTPLTCIATKLTYIEDSRGCSVDAYLACTCAPHLEFK